MQSANLTLGRPIVGWLPIQIKTSDFNLSLEASYLGLNVIDQLIDMAIKFDDGQASQCYFYLEPGAYIVNVEPRSNIAILQIQFVEDFNNQDISDPVIQFQGEINTMEFRMSLLNALRAFRDCDYEMSDWPAPDKSAILNQILDS